MYTSRIHKCAKILMHIYAHGQNVLPLNVKLTASNYIAKFNAKKKYGISYAGFGLISFASFSKVNI